MPADVLDRWGQISLAVQEVLLIKQGIYSGQIKADDGYIDIGSGRKKKKKWVKGGNTHISEIMVKAGLLSPADPIFRKAWDAYQRLQKNAPNAGMVTGHRPDGSEITMRDNWVDYILREAIVQCFKRKRVSFNG